MCRKNGTIIKEMEKLNDKSIFTLDSKSNIIEINSQSNKIKLFNINNQISIESTYNSNFVDFETYSIVYYLLIRFDLIL